jgi:hypothetical protein
VIVLTAGDDRVGTDALGSRERDTITFRSMVRASIDQAHKLGYRTIVYDLGGLGFGTPLAVEDGSFAAQGFYRQVTPEYRSKALHKPEIVARCLSENDEPVLYLDADAVLVQPVGEIFDGWDLAVTLRHPYEMTGAYYRRNVRAMGLINAGVILLCPHARTRTFVERWRELSLEVGSDQAALNDLLAPEDRSALGQTVEKSGVSVRYLDVLEYNFYHFRLMRPPDGVRVFHFKGGVRSYFARHFPEYARG